jgi:deoxyribodipyrimidine photo-lyase
MQIVWFKRDLRATDHAPLFAAMAAGPVLPLYIFEPDVFGAPDASPQHLAFVKECLAELRLELSKLGLKLHTAVGNVTDVMSSIHRKHAVNALWSHEETGNAVTFARDQAVLAWCRGQGIPWHEPAQFGVFRRLKTRDGWAARWRARVGRPVLPQPMKSSAAVLPQWVDQELPGLGDDKGRHRQRGGRTHALACLRGFLHARGQHYQKAMSSPLSAESACSRLSPYLAWGCISMTEIWHAVQERRQALLAMPEFARPQGFLAALRSFEGRLYWHCHFIQKLESEPALEHRDLIPAFAGLRPNDPHSPHLHAWMEGQTGYPMIDASMRMLRATGWLNFRMRSMLVSFAAYNLWLDWRLPALHLAREFLDYEPGIHYCQMQMQSGTTGINALRIYNPVKQAHDHDPDGAFVRRWVPELFAVPTPLIFEPAQMSSQQQSQHGVRIGRDYPAPIVPWAETYRAAREAMAAARRDVMVQREAQAVMQKHGSRKSGIAHRGEGPVRPTGKARQPKATVPPPQLELPFD